MLLSVEDIFKILKKNGIKKGDNIFLHIDAFVTAFIVGSSLEKIGRASCRERVKIPVVAVSLKKKNRKHKTELKHL